LLLRVSIVLLAAVVSGSMAFGGGNCTTPRAVPVLLHAPSGAMVLVHDGNRGTLSSAINGVIPPGAFNATIEQMALMERTRLPATAPDRCFVPRSGENPWDLRDRSGKQFAPFVSNYTMADFDCYVYNYTYVRQGVEIRALKLTASNHEDPAFQTIVVYEFATEDLTIYPSTNTTYTDGIPYKNQWMYARKANFSEICGNKVRLFLKTL
jgi:hypothetical protein